MEITDTFEFTVTYITQLLFAGSYFSSCHEIF